jgi:hypothetical protein
VLWHTQVYAHGWVVHESYDSFGTVRQCESTKQTANSVAIFQGRRRRSLLKALDLGERSIMRQLQDTLVWLGMILVVAGVIYVVPLMASLASDDARNEHGSSCVTCSQVSVTQHHGFSSHVRRER